MIISFSTTIKLASELGKPEPLSAGIKTVTRRLWSPKTHAQILRAYEAGKRTHQAWSNCSFVKGAYCLGSIELSQAPYYEKLEDMPDEDVYCEGDLWSTKEGFIKVLDCSPEAFVSVIRFQFSGKLPTPIN